MKSILLLIAFLLAGPAYAQNRPACYPLINGYPAKAPQILKSGLGTHLFWFCSDSKSGPIRPEGLSCLASHCSEAIASQVISTITRASAKVGSANSLWDQHVAFNCPDVESEQTPRGALCRERKNMLLLNAKAWGLK